jgi:hypothetical protein
MRVYHLTVRATAAVIMTDGFKDTAEKYVSDFEWRGVWVSEHPSCPDASGDTVLTLDIPEHVFAAYEWIYEARSDRGSLIPAAVLNKFGRPQIKSDTPMPIAAPSTTSAA